MSVAQPPFDDVDEKQARVMSPAMLEEIGAKINDSTQLFAEVSATKADRKLRSFRAADIEEISGLSKDQIGRWRRKHRETLDCIRSSGAADAPEISQMPLTMAEIHLMMADFDRIPRRPSGCRAMRIGCFSFKGGVTKSTTALNLACYYATHGWRVLLVDSDPQGSLSAMFGHEPESTDSANTLLPALRSLSSANAPPTLRPLHTHIDGLDLIPASLDMIGADFEIAAAFTRRVERDEPRFFECVARGLRTVEDAYDLVLVDSAPAFSFTAIAAMWASDGMVIPVPPSAPDYRATAAFCSMAGDGLSTLCTRAKQPNRTWAPVMFLHNRVRAKGQSTDIIQHLASRTLGHHLCRESVPDVAAVPNALNLQMSVFEASSTNVGGRGLRRARDAYAEVADRLLLSIRAAWDLGYASQEAPP